MLTLVSARWADASSPGTTVDWPGFWRASEEAQQIFNMIEKISARNSGQQSTDNDHHPAFAAPFMVQVTELLKRQVLRPDLE